MRNNLTVAAGAALVICLVWLSGRHTIPMVAAPEPLSPDTPYSLPVSAGQAVFDLEFGPHDSYRLLVSSFATVEETARISVKSEKIKQVEQYSGERVAPLSVRPLQVGNVSDHAAGSVIDRDLENFQQPQSPVTDRHQKILPVGYIAESRDRDFYLHVTDGSLEKPEGYTRVSGAVIADGEFCRVYLDRQEPKSDSILRLAEELVRVFDEEVLPRTRATLGTHRDVDGDGKLAFLLTPWLGRLQGGETTLKGFTRSTDFRTGVPAPFSNQCDVIYLNSQLRAGAELRDLIAHEYAHAVSFSIRQGSKVSASSLPDEEDWLNEGVAHLAENLSGSGWTNIDYRVSRYLDDPSRYPLIVLDYYRSGLWREHGCRGATYLFLRWISDVWGSHLPAALMRSPTAGVASLERLTGVPFHQLYRHFNLAVVTEGAVAGSSGNVSPVVQQSPSLKAFSLYSRLGAWQLAGPHWESLDVDSPTVRQIELRGTSTKFLHLQASGIGGARRIRIEGNPSSRLQLTLIRCRPDAPSLAINAAWENLNTIPGSLNTADSKSVALVIEVAPESSRLINLDTVVLEQNYDEVRRSVFAHPAGTIPSGASTDDRVLHRFVVPRESLEGITKSWHVKAVGQDALGRRVSATATLPEWKSESTDIAGREGTTRRF